MQAGRSALTLAHVFFWCAALSVVLGFWRAARMADSPVARLRPEAIFAIAMFGLYVAGALLALRRLPTLSLPAARQSTLIQAGIGLLLAAMLLNLR